MSDQNQWPKPGEQQPDDQRRDASAPAPGSAAEPNGYGQDTPQQQYGSQQQPQYGQQSQHGAQYGQQPQYGAQPGQYGQSGQQPQYGAQQGQHGQQQGQYGQSGQYGAQPGQYGQQQYGQAQQPQYGAPQNQHGQQPGQYNPYAQQNPYAPAGYQPYAQRPKTNLLAILSIVFGLGAIPLFFIAILLGPAGAIMGHVALGKLKHNGEQGRGLALTGIIAGWVMTAVWILWVVVLAVTIGHSGGYSDYGTDFGSDSGAFVS